MPVTEFRAAVVVGSGSISFEMIRYLTERLPVMVCPQWVYTRVQPIAVDDLLRYLVAALDVPESAGRVVEVGGADVLTYGEMMLGYADARGLWRHLQPVPVLTPTLSSYWVHLVTPIPSQIARPLIEGLRNETVVRDHSAHDLFPAIHPVGYATAVRAAVASLDTGEVETSWADALVTSGGDVQPRVLTTQEGKLIERRQALVAATPEEVFAVVRTIGGRRGYRAWDWAWELRGAVDRLVGGVGLRRGRRDPVDVRVGDALDFWRVEAVEPGRLLRLRAEMKVPGAAWLQFETLPHEQGTLLVQTAYFAPRGRTGTRLLVRAAACPQQDILGYDCCAGRRGRPAGCAGGGLIGLCSRVRPPSRGGAAGALDGALLRRKSASLDHRCDGEDHHDDRRRATAAIPSSRCWTSSSRRPGTSSRSCPTSSWRCSGSRAPTGSSRTRGGASTTRSCSPSPCSPASSSDPSASSCTPSCARP